MKNIKLDETLIDVFFGGMDPECLDQIKELVEQGATLDPISGELILNNIKTGIYTDFDFKKEC